MRTVNLSGFFIIVAVTLFGALLGVLGALTAVPLAATIQIFVQELTKARREKVAAAHAALEATAKPALAAPRSSTLAYTSVGGVRLPAPPHVDRLSNLPQHDPDHGHRLAGHEVLVVPPGARSACHSARSSYSLDFVLRSSPRLIGADPIALLQPLENGPQVRVQLATGRVSDPCYRSPACPQRSPVARVRIPYAP